MPDSQSILKIVIKGGLIRRNFSLQYVSAAINRKPVINQTIINKDNATLFNEKFRRIKC
jgi:hypothetical protein